MGRYAMTMAIMNHNSEVVSLSYFMMKSITDNVNCMVKYWELLGSMEQWAFSLGYFVLKSEKKTYIVSNFR